MYDYISGQVKELTPTYAVIDIHGTGFFINISLNTYSSIQENSQCKLYIYEAIREDSFQLYGFSTKKEREIFVNLISVSGVGANTARMMLSSLSPDEIVNAILHNDIVQLKSIKGIGAKSAQRIIVDLKDKIGKASNLDEIITSLDNTIKEEALSALVMLGFQKTKAEKVVESVIRKNKDLNLEEIIKESLKQI